MKTMENQEKRNHNQRILDGENGSSIPLVFTANEGMSTETKQFYRRLSQLSKKLSFLWCVSIASVLTEIFRLRWALWKSSIL